jgi:hypothetical protein
MNEIPESRRALEGRDRDTQCTTEVKQSHLGTCRLVWLLDGGPRRNSVHNQSVENAPEHVEDTVSELCGRSTDANVKNIDSVDKKPSGL